jgi:outer membrane protein TolC
MFGIAPETAGSSLGSRENIKISQALPWFGKLAASRKNADSTASATANAVAAFQRELALEASHNWAEWWYVNQALSINETIVSSFELLTRSANSRYQNGQGKQQDALQSEMRLLHAQHQRVTLQQQGQRLAIQLNQLRNRPLENPVLAPAAMPAMPAIPKDEELLTSLEQHPAYLAALDLVIAAEARLSLAKRERYPDFVAEVAHVGTLDPEEKRWQVGLGLNLPFDQGKRRHGVAAAMANKQKLALDAQAKLLALKEQLASQLSRYQEHLHIEALYTEQLLPLAKQSQQAAQQDYANGISDFDTVTAAITDYQKAAMQLRRHQADRFMILAEIEQLAGRQLHEFNSHATATTTQH